MVGSLSFPVRIPVGACVRLARRPSSRCGPPVVRLITVFMRHCLRAPRSFPLQVRGDPSIWGQREDLQGKSMPAPARARRTGFRWSRDTVTMKALSEIAGGALSIAAPGVLAVPCMHGQISMLAECAPISGVFRQTTR
jgi:hypothetical protein